MKLRTTTWNLFEIGDSLHVRKFKTFLDSGFHAVDSEFEVLDVGILCRWNLDSGFQFASGLELYSGFQSPEFWFPQLKFLGFRIPQAKISRIPLRGAR